MFKVLSRDRTPVEWRVQRHNVRPMIEAFMTAITNAWEVENEVRFQELSGLFVWTLQAVANRYSDTEEQFITDAVTEWWTMINEAIEKRHWTISLPT